MSISTCNKVGNIRACSVSQSCVAYSGYGTVKKDAKMVMKMIKRKWEFFFFFHSFTMHLDIITSLFAQLNAQLDCSRSVKIYINLLAPELFFKF